MDPMPKPRLPHLEHYRTRHGKWKWYFRVDKGPRVRLPDDYGSPEFKAAYRAALAGEAPAKTTEGRTLAWLIEEYLASPGWKNTAKETRKQFRYQFERMKKKAGRAYLQDIDTASVARGRDDRSATPSDANKFIKASRKLFQYAVERGAMKADPTAGVKLLKLPNVDGFHTWTEDEVALYEARWPVGSRERLALDIMLYTGLRRSDAVRLGRQHMKAGRVTIRTEKSVNSGHPVAVTVTVLPPLMRSIMATKTGALSFLATAKGTPFAKESFGTWFRKACDAAGVPGSCHGLRKIAAIRCAENGATEAEMNAMFGWSDRSRESAVYIRKASREKLGVAASERMISPTPFPTPIKKDAETL
jgi:integrase